MNKKILAHTVIPVVILIVLLSSCSKPNIVDIYNYSYKVDTESYTEMILNIINYGSSTNNVKSMLKNRYSEYISPELFRQLEEFKTAKITEPAGDILTVYNEGDLEDGSYPIYDYSGNTSGYGTYEEYIESKTEYKEYPLNSISYIEQYDNMLLVMVNNKYNGAVFIRFKIDNDGVLSDVAFLK